MPTPVSTSERRDPVGLSECGRRSAWRRRRADPVSTSERRVPVGRRPPTSRREGQRGGPCPRRRGAARRRSRPCAAACTWRGARPANASRSAVSSSSGSASTMAWTRLPRSSSGSPITAHRTHGRVLLQRRLDLGRVDVRATGEDHVLHAVAEVEVAVLVEPAHVAERLPAALERPGLGADVAVGRPVGRVAHPHLALLAGRQRVAVGVGDHELAGDRPADRAAVLQPLGAR